MIPSFRSIARNMSRHMARRVVPALALPALLAACGSDGGPTDVPSNPAVETYAPALGVSIPQMTKRSDNLYTQDLTVGTGTELAAGDSLEVRYTGWLVNGSRFDSGTIPFRIGVQQVIRGWDEGLPGMKVGGKRKLVIGSDWAYGPVGQGPIPPNATLVFDAELLKVVKR
jgi:FKBP-type peptidyl-prolyl cis-trans isomerase FkpA